MCFIVEDYDWLARDVVSSTVTADGSKRFRCSDCHEAVPFMEECELTEMWEYEQCSDCGLRHEEDSACIDGACLDEDEEPITEDRGESCSYHRCRVCLDFRKGIRDLELKEGCGENEAEPHGSITAEFGNMNDRGRVAEYIEHACSMFPQRASAIREKYDHFLEE